MDFQLHEHGLPEDNSSSQPLLSSYQEACTCSKIADQSLSCVCLSATLSTTSGEGFIIISPFDGETEAEQYFHDLNPGI